MLCFAAGGGTINRGKIFGFEKRPVIPSEARNLALIFVPLFAPKQSKIPRCPENSSPPPKEEGVGVGAHQPPLAPP